MTHVLHLELPSELLGVAQQVFGSLGEPVRIPATLVAKIDRVMDQTLAETLLDVRERERALSSEALKLRIR